MIPWTMCSLWYDTWPWCREPRRLSYKQHKLLTMVFLKIHALRQTRVLCCRLWYLKRHISWSPWLLSSDLCTSVCFPSDACVSMWLSASLVWEHAQTAWPISLVLSRRVLTKYQLLFRHLFHCKHVERQLCQVWHEHQVSLLALRMSRASTLDNGVVCLITKHQAHYQGVICVSCMCFVTALSIEVCLLAAYWPLSQVTVFASGGRAIWQCFASARKHLISFMSFAIYSQSSKNGESWNSLCTLFVNGCFGVPLMLAEVHTLGQHSRRVSCSFILLVSPHDAFHAKLWVLHDGGGARTELACHGGKASWSIQYWSGMTCGHCFWGPSVMMIS